MKRANSLLTGLALLDSIDYVRLKSVKMPFFKFKCETTPVACVIGSDRRLHV